jgi:hypothetical protein
VKGERRERRRGKEEKKEKGRERERGREGGREGMLRAKELLGTGDFSKLKQGKSRAMG